MGKPNLNENPNRAKKLGKAIVCLALKTKTLAKIARV
jgi:hypothetical protein